jgi:hypothetical protein
VNAEQPEDKDATAKSPAGEEVDISQHKHLWNSFWYHGIFHPHDQGSGDGPKGT